MRIVSCLPAATAWLQLFGAGEDIVGRSDGCRLHAGMADTSGAGSLLDGLASTPIAISGLQDVPVVTEHGEVDASLIRRLLPEVIIASAGQAAMIAAALPGIEILTLAPFTFKQAVDAGLRIAHRVGRIAEGMQFIAEQEYRLKRLRDKFRLTKSTPEALLPSVVLLQPGSAPLVGGLWIPDIIGLAGGVPLFATSGRPAVWVSAEDLRAADVIVRLSLSAIGTNPSRLPAAPFLHPGPNLYQAVQLLADLLHPAP